MTSLFSKPKTPKPTVMPEAEDERARKARELLRQQAAMRQGRAASILSDFSGTDLGVK